MYAFNNLTQYFGDLELFENVSLVVSPGEKLALLGKNGAGKTTLFKIISGEIKPEKGEINIPKSTRIAYLSQHFDFKAAHSPREICREAFAHYYELNDKIDKAHLQLGETQNEDEINKILAETARLQIQLDSYKVTNPEAEIERILTGLGFDSKQLDQPASKLSGGWQMRIQIAQLILSEPDLLLLDEPDNHLDIEALIWFENYIRKYTGAVIFISHDVEFIRNVATRIVELRNKKLFDFKGSYDKFLGAKELKEEAEVQAYNNQQKVIKSKERTINRFIAKASKTKMAQSMQKQLDKMERIEPEKDDFNKMKIIFPVVHDPGKIVMRIDDLSKSYGANEVLENVELEILRGQKIAFIGQNGQGKSTLIKIMANQIPYDSGVVEKGHNVLLNYFAQDQSDILDEKLTVLQTMEKEADPEFKSRARHILGSFAFSGDDVDKKVSVLSGGEKSRLAMACLVSRKSNFLLLDEPTNHLDIQAKELLKTAIITYPGTLVIVSHDRHILDGTVDMCYEFRDKNIHQHLGDLNYVLEKRNSKNVREFEMSKPDSGSAKKSKSQPDYEAEKKLRNKLSNVERNIEKLENSIQDIHQKLADPAFYRSPDSEPAIKKLNQLETELEKKTSEWEALVSKHEL